jgi:hypothetical protein
MSNDMCLYYFHVRSGDVIYLDHQGVELSDLKAAWEHALEDARDVLKVCRGDAGPERWIEVHDRGGHIVSTPASGVVFH